MKEKSKIWLIGMITLLCFVVVEALVYHFGNLSVPNPDTNLAARNIESAYKLWLNGYLGLFFGFKSLGNINWLIIPLAIWFYWKHKNKLHKEHWAIAVFFLLAAILIALKGFFNPRYAFTLLGFCVFMVYFFIYKLFDPISKHLYEIGVGLLIIATLYNFKQEVGTIRFKEKLSKILFDEKPTESVAAPIIKEENISNESLTSLIERGDYGNTFLVNNLPNFYYHTSKKGLYYWSGDDHYYSEKGKEKLFERLDKSGIYNFFESHECHYIYTHESYEGYNKAFDTFVRNNCELIITDPEGHQLYQLKNG